MKTSLIAALSAAVIATLAGSAANAAVKTIDFGVSALGGDPGVSFSGGASLDQSTAFDLDGALLIVSSVGANDSSGLVVFDPANPPGSPDTVDIAPRNLEYGNSAGPLGTNIVKSWEANGDTYTETLTTVLSINRATQNAITVVLQGTLTDMLGDFNGSPAFLILQANQASNGGAISVALTDTSTLAPGTPEPSTWVMMALGFSALGYAATRKGKAKVATLSA